MNVWFNNLLQNNCTLGLQAVRERLVQLMFETFNVSGFYATEQAVLSLYAVGRISGCTVDIGHGKIGILDCKFLMFICLILAYYKCLVRFLLVVYDYIFL